MVHVNVMCNFPYIYYTPPVHPLRDLLLAEATYQAMKQWMLIVFLTTWKPLRTFQFSSVAQSCPTLCDSMDSSMPGFPVHHQLPEPTQTHVHWLNQWCHPTILSSVIPFSSLLHSLPASGSFLRLSSLHQVAKVLEFQLQHQSFQWIFRTDFL